jgi:hypothetical protein
MRFFFYGTLVDEDVRRAVLGPHAPRHVEPALLDGWRRVPVRGRTYPVVVADPAASVDGVLVRGLNAAARRRLERYEDADLYEVTTLDVLPTGRMRPVQAFVFVAKAAGFRRGSGRWEIGEWRRRHKRRFLLTPGRRPAA